VLATILGYLDDWGHTLHLPDRVQAPLCDAFDRSIGVYDE